MIDCCDLFKTFLDASVSLRVHTLMDNGGPGDEDFARVQGSVELLGEKGNFIFEKSKRVGETAKVANAVADAIAVLSFAPGGITLFDKHWESIYHGESTCTQVTIKGL